jgi:hypothetical protein
LARGGYRKPNNPAPVSGPGALSQRTDGGPGDKQAARYISGLPYGEGQQMMNTQQSAPMAAAPGIESSGMAMAPGMAAPPIVPLTAPSSRPNEPITAGINLGPGPDSSSLRTMNTQDMVADDNYRAQIASYLPALLRIAASPNTSPTTRAIIRKIRDQV